MTVLNNADQMFSGSEQVMGVYQGSDFIWGPFNKATGGTEATITNYNGSGETWKTHTFTSGTSSLNVSMSMQPFRVLVVGGGGGGNCNTYGGGGGGGGALHYNAAQTLSVGSYPVTVGTGGPKGGPESARYTPDDPTYKGDGRPSSFNGVTAGGGGGGATYANVGRNAPSGGGGGGGGSHAGLNAGGSGGIGGSGAASNNTEGGNYGGGGGGMGPSGGSSGNGSGTTPGPGRTIDITGTAVEYCRGGRGGRGTATTPPPANTGQGGDGNGNIGGGAPTSQTGSAGVVIVAYRIG